MAIPSFTAESSLYRSNRNYRTMPHGGFAGSEIIAQEAFACLPDDSACACSGLGDCIDCANLGHCTGHCECDSSGTCICEGPGL
jgi:hypothetical protein